MTRTSSDFRATGGAAAQPSNVYTVLLVIACAFVLTAIVCNLVDLMGNYGVGFGKAIWPF